MSVLLELGLDTIGLILRKVGVRPSRCVADVLAKVRRGDRSAASPTCKRLHDVALLRGWPPPVDVLRGQSMKIVINEQELEQHVVKLLNDLPENKVLIDHFLEHAIEAEADAICDGEDVYIIGIMEHIEPAGIHSGDSYAVLPPFDLSENVIKQIEAHTKKIALALKTVGLINIQFAVKNEVVYIIEANPRASRTAPFIAKAYDEPYVNYATKVMLREKKVKDFTFNPRKKGYAIKIPVFSYEKFPKYKRNLAPK